MSTRHREFIIELTEGGDDGGAARDDDRLRSSSWLLLNCYHGHNKYGFLCYKSSVIYITNERIENSRDSQRFLTIISWAST